GAKTILDGLSFELGRRETLCLAGESGSGKSMTALAIMGLLPKPMARISRGSIQLGNLELTRLSERQYRKIRAARISMIFQEPMTSLNPISTVQKQLCETLLEHGQCSRQEAPDRALALLKDVRLTEPEQRLQQYPHELSGGMRQRVMIAMALACDPEILIADEPTTALDVTVQAEILELMRSLQKEHNTGLLMITHDMGVVAEMADRVLVMKEGQEVETAAVRQLFSKPVHPYSQALLKAVPRLGSSEPKEPLPTTLESVVQIKDLKVHFFIRGGVFNRPVARIHAVENVSLSIRAGSTLALVGESGCGKSTIGKAMMGLVPWSGQIQLNGDSIAGLSRPQMQRVLRNIQMIFQDPGASLDPRMKVGDQVGEPMVVHGIARGTELKDRVAYLFQRVGLSRDAIERYPHEFSGGQRQRICIARALSLSPKVIIADECVSALDVSIQAQVLELLKELQQEDDLAYLFISHDMAVIEQMADEVAVMRLGQIVEHGYRDAVLRDPRHSYTQRLLSAVPIPDPEIERTQPRRETSAEPESPIFKLHEQPTPLHLQEIAPGHLVAS
ncbi:MAG: dipeptide ABC transporter ATP-binding protein, partial [bacterium]